MDLMGVLEELKKKTNSPEFSEWIRKYMEEYRKYKEKVSSKEYINWVYDYISTNKQADDERAVYVYQGVDSENGQLLGDFLNYVKELARQQRVLVELDECEFGDEEVVVKIKDKYFKIFRMHMQGESMTSISLLDKEPDYAFVKILS